MTSSTIPNSPPASKPRRRVSNRTVTINHALLLPILIYYVDKKGLPVLGKPRPGPQTERFLENEANLDIAVVIPAIKELHYPIRLARSK